MRRALVSSLLLSSLLGCGRAATQPSAAIPAGYVEAVTAGRSEKDRDFIVDIPTLRDILHTAGIAVP